MKPGLALPPLRRQDRELPSRPLRPATRVYEFLCYEQGWSIRKVADACGVSTGVVEDALEFEGTGKPSAMDDTLYSNRPRHLGT